MLESGYGCFSACLVVIGTKVERILHGLGHHHLNGLERFAWQLWVGGYGLERVLERCR